MRFGLRRGASAEIEAADGALLPGESASVTVTLPAPLERVRAGRVALGYHNTFAYRWAGRRDMTVAYDDTSFFSPEQGTSYGSDRVIDEWVPVLAEDLPLAGDRLEEGARTVAIRIPSWAPGSSERLVRWAARLEIERDGARDIADEAELTVLAPAPGEPPAELRQTRVAGDSSDIDIRTERPDYRAGDEVRGTIAITPRSAVPDAEVGVLLQLQRVSHPLERTPAETVGFDGKVVIAAKQIALPEGRTTEIPFAVPLPADAAPTAEAVHASLDWYVHVRLFYKGFSSHLPERVNREIVVWNGPR